MSTSDPRIVMIRPGAGNIVLDRVEPDVLPEYCIHGRVPCLTCGHWCWLGSRTYELVASGNAHPTCLQCANALYAKGTRPTGRFTDHRYDDGPHQ